MTLIAYSVFIPNLIFRPSLPNQRVEKFHSVERVFLTFIILRSNTKALNNMYIRIIIKI